MGGGIKRSFNVLFINRWSIDYVGTDKNTYTLNIIQHIRDTSSHDSSINPVHVRTADRKNMSEGKTNHRRITVTQNVIYQEIESSARLEYKLYTEFHLLNNLLRKRVF